ncbi:TPA: CDP-glycerol glycerophosphotransferase family protein [Vibrio parahaemolyticus]|nr:CDP-glycerol glycerophosphotransferase family protein [Vibrio parahaemolyticus]HBB9973088.1 CDP-glycerol glycerophosphotransferase family protein [Vibrio parahaemolyticus]HBC0008985.1 CDP-glycerol glycerophosphotransferase family protein [Vibrio parahaemolyticus]
MSFFSLFKTASIQVMVRLVNVIFPRNNDLIIIGSWFGERYADNSRYLFESLTKNANYDVYWVTRNIHLYNELKEKYTNVILIGTFKSFIYHIRAGLFLFDQGFTDFDYALSRGAVRVNLWHGIPLKKVGIEANQRHNRVQSRFEYISNFLLGRKIDFVVSPTTFTDLLFDKCFDEQLIRGPYPRVNYLKSDYESYNLKTEASLLNIIRAKNKKVIMYLPTFRDNMPLKFFGGENLSYLLQEIDKMGYILVTKCHLAEELFHKENIELNSEVINIPADCDIYPFLKESDILVTDYSSVYFDFLSLNREIVFFPYDLEYYKYEDRGLMLDYEQYTPGAKAYNIKDFLKIISGINSGEVSYELERKELIEKIEFDQSCSEFIRILKDKNGIRV